MKLSELLNVDDQLPTSQLLFQHPFFASLYSLCHSRSCTYCITVPPNNLHLLVYRHQHNHSQDLLSDYRPMSTQPQHQLPEWETPTSPQKPQRTLFNKSRLSSSHTTAPPLDEASHKETAANPPLTTRDRRFSDHIPQWLSLFGTSRKLLLSSLAALLLLILIIGLAVGLTRNKKFVAFWNPDHPV